MALMVLRTCQQVEGGLPANVKAKMYFNIILDFGIGLVPILGDVADVSPDSPILHLEFRCHFFDYIERSY